MAAGNDLRDPIGSKPQGWIGCIGIIGAAILVFGRVGEVRLVHMGRQDVEIVDPGIVAGEFVDMHRERFLVVLIDAGDAVVKLEVADAGRRFAASTPGEQDVIGGNGRAVAPYRIGTNGVGERDPLLAVGGLLDLRRSALKVGQLGA